MSFGAITERPRMPRAPDLSGVALDGRYELHAVIGEGTFGRVYRGLDRRLARPVAVKVIKPWWSEDPEWVRSFEREAQLLASISDPGIVQIYDVGAAPEGLYYVAELVEGESLARALERGPMVPELAGEIAIQLCHALAHAHADRVVHRDIKPENVLISGDGRIKVGDFGVARLAEGSTDGAGATVVGTPRYMAPEQAQGGRISPATDVYGVGVVLYEMLAGRPPFAGRSAVELAVSHVTEPPPPLPQVVPAALVEVVVRALAKKPAERYGDGAEMAGALAQALVGAPGQLHSTQPRLRLQPVPWPDPAPPDHRRAVPLDQGRPGADRRSPEDRTQVGDPRTPRRNVNASERRQRRGLFALVALLVAGLLAGGVALAPAHVRVPDLRGLTRDRIVQRLDQAGLRATFTSQYSAAAAGSGLRQRPAAGMSVKVGAAVAVLLSAGAPPVNVPPLIGTSADQAQATLARLKLQTRIDELPAPGVATGQVTRQSPAAGTSLVPPSPVTLIVAQAPRWRPLTSISGTSSGRSVPFRIRGAHWRLVYSMSYPDTCTFVVFCSGPSAQVIDSRTGQPIDGFDLDDAGGQVHAVDAGPGLYQVVVSPGTDTARWRIDVQDRY